jgi:hypothetical protein
MSSTTQTCFSGSYGLILIVCGPRPPSNKWSHCVHDSSLVPFASTTTMQLRITSGADSLREAEPIEP